MKKSWIAYIAILHIVLAGLVLRSDFPRRMTNHLGITVSKTSNPFIQLTRQAHKQMDASVPMGAIIFLGDSITQGLATTAVTPYSVNYGISMERSDELIDSMKIYQSIERSAAVVVTIGLNDLNQGKSENLEARYRTILEAIPQRIPVVMSSVTPTSTIAIGDLRKARDSARAACKDRTKCTFVDGLELLAPNEITLLGVILPDGLHLSPEGYALWIPALRRALTLSPPAQSFDDGGI
jgi:hypothetical protein